MHLAKRPNQKPILVAYIYHQNKKGKPQKIDLPLLKNDITSSEPIFKTTDT
jgi:hypothetical protein